MVIFETVIFVSMGAVAIFGESWPTLDGEKSLVEEAILPPRKSQRMAAALSM